MGLVLTYCVQRDGLIHTTWRVGFQVLITTASLDYTPSLFLWFSFIHLIDIYYRIDIGVSAEYTAMNKKELYYCRGPWFSTL